MSFKELLQRYREGTVTTEEAQRVEKELEKYESIEQYFSEDLSEQFSRDEVLGKDVKNDLEKDENQEPKKDFSIQKLVNRRLQKVVLASVVVVVLLYMTIFYGVSALIDAIHYNPEAVTMAEEDHYPETDFHFDITAYTSLNMPGFAISSFTPVVSEGFGNYEVHYPLRNLFTRETQSHRAKISRDSLTFTDGGIFHWENRAFLWEGFHRIRYPREYASKDINETEKEDYREQEEKRKNDITLEYLEKLNPLSYISMHMVFEEDLSLLEFHHLSREHPALDFKWVGVRTAPEGQRWSENQPMHLIGFNPSQDEPSGNRRPDKEKYPLFYLEDRWDNPPRKNEDYARDYETHFLSRLKYLSGRREFIDIFDYNPYKWDFYQESLDYLEEHGVYTYGVVVYGTAEDFLEVVEELPFASLYIDQVLPVSPSIYY